MGNDASFPGILQSSPVFPRHCPSGLPWSQVATEREESAKQKQLSNNSRAISLIQLLTNHASDRYVWEQILGMQGSDPRGTDLRWHYVLRTCATNEFDASIRGFEADPCFGISNDIPPASHGMQRQGTEARQLVPKPCSPTGRQAHGGLVSEQHPPLLLLLLLLVDRLRVVVSQMASFVTAPCQDE